jgi:MYXO-CTERM domain-containing protein
VRQANNTGVLNTVGSLGGNITNLVGFDISAFNNAFAASQDVSQSLSMFWSINLATGQATAIGQIGGGTMIDAIAVVPAPASLTVLAGLGAVTLRRRRNS